MHRSRTHPAVIVGVVIILAACGSTTSTTSTEPSRTESPATSPSRSAASPSESAPESEAAGERETVRLHQFNFDPEELTIAVGTEVVFVNADDANHTVTEGADGIAVEDPIIDEELEQNGSTSYTFGEPGTFQITCRIHTSMHLTITVEG